MVVSALCGLLACTLPLDLLPHVSFLPGGLHAILPPGEAEQAYRVHLEEFCRSLNPPDEVFASAQPSVSTPQDEETSLRVPRSLLPGSYDEAIARAKNENKILMVVLESEAHEHTTRFRTETLLNPNLDKLLVQENILLWAADVSSRDATQGTPLVHDLRAKVLTHMPFSGAAASKYNVPLRRVYLLTA